MDASNQILLVIESAILGGSLALFRNGKKIAEHTGDSDVSRSEDLLPNIASMLDSAEIQGNNLERIIVSRGPGSFTGLRIGIATALGLAKALGITADGVSLFDAMSVQPTSSRRRLSAVPFGRNDIAWQITEHGKQLNIVSGPTASSIAEFVQNLNTIGDVELIIHSDMISRLDGHFVQQFTVHDLGTNLAAVIGAAILSNDLSVSGLEPIYLSNLARRA